MVPLPARLRAAPTVAPSGTTQFSDWFGPAGVADGSARANLHLIDITARSSILDSQAWRNTGSVRRHAVRGFGFGRLARRGPRCAPEVPSPPRRGEPARAGLPPRRAHPRPPPVRPCDRSDSILASSPPSDRSMPSIWRPAVAPARALCRWPGIETRITALEAEVATMQAAVGGRHAHVPQLEEPR